jgi:hypothetical protein
MKKQLLGALLTHCLIIGLPAGNGSVEREPSSESQPLPAAASRRPLPVGFRADVATVSTYIFRGQRLTNDWSLQPSGTLSIGDFSFNVWGTLDLAAVNEGESLYLPLNPSAPPGKHNGLKGRFSEVDYTFSYEAAVRRVGLQAGVSVYTFPERTATLRTTTELYGGTTLDLPLSPSATLYVDVDESRTARSTGLYLKLGASQSVPLRHHVFPAIDLAGSLGFANRALGAYYYDTQESGAHDLNLTVTLPVRINERWSASAFVAYSALLGGFRELQYGDLRQAYRGRPGPGEADTVWGGCSVSLAF